MEGLLLGILLMLVTWWIMFRTASWLGGWNDGGKN